MNDVKVGQTNWGVGFRFLTAIIFKMSVSWDIASCILQDWPWWRQETALKRPSASTTRCNIPEDNHLNIKVRCVPWVVILLASLSLIRGNSMEQRSSWDDSLSVSLILCFLRKLKVYCNVHKIPPLTFTLNHISSAHRFKTHDLKIHFNIILSLPRHYTK